ncbi:hypothetical protein N7447_004310 [Penicillium robsamsonii]|uniref:uncharacterized protein n=1 Tax=Penicillium robsamsonii TaxID=1792511 RepID=UPI002547909B|nr:uncharacterized protein N7447_004310 [Penicillium robsamsonii]KAJ5827547.1 hypothetical protein N7447_004310 [Penicillium robsamsonii]
MDVQNSSLDQEIEGDQQPSELPNLSEKDKSQETSDHVPPLPSPSQQEAETRHTLVTEPSARLIGIYRRVWESCVSKHIDGQKLEQNNLVLKEVGAQLRKERDLLQLRHDKQLSRLRVFEQALELSRERLSSVIDGWNHPSRLNLAGLPDIAREG